MDDGKPTTEVQREMWVGSLNLWSIGGALGAQYCSDTWGRRRTFVVAAIWIIAGIFVTVVSQTYTMLVLGRGLIGIGVGAGFAIDPLYIAEITPAEHRGELVTWSEIAINIGIVFGFSMGLILGRFELDSGTEWRVMLSLGCIMPAVMILLVSAGVMPESPRWLVANQRHDEAREILSRIYPPGFDITSLLQDITEAIQRDAAAEKAIGWAVLFHATPAFQRMLLVGVGTAVAQQAIGIDSIQYYLLDIIEQTGIESREQQGKILVCMGLTKLVFIVIGGKCFDRQGRRPLLFVSLLLMYLALGLVGIANLSNSSAFNTRAQLAGMVLYLAAFSIGMGPGAWLIPSEVFSISIRAKAMALATAMNRAMATVMSSTFLSITEVMGFGAYCCLLAIICVLIMTFLYFYLPETKGRSLEDMSIYFAELTGDTKILAVEAKITGDKKLIDAEAELSQRSPHFPLSGSDSQQQRTEDTEFLST